MSDREFDNYLALLARLLRLGEKQRQAIAGELRAHLEDRLEELMSRGVPRDEAVQQALEEFGDAAALASEFVSVSKSRKRRWIMRLTTASVAATVLVAAAIFTFWPGTNAGPGPAATIAQDPFGDPPAAADPNTPVDPAGQVNPFGGGEPTLEEKLDRRIDAEFVETPLTDVIAMLQEKTGIQFVIKAKMLEENGINIDIPVTRTLKNVRLSTLLDLMLEELNLACSHKDDLLVITTIEDQKATHEVRVYDCRVLLQLPTPPGSVQAKGPPGRGGFFAVQDEPPTKAADADGGAAPPVGGSSPADSREAAGSSSAGGLGGFAGKEAPLPSDVDNLIEVITQIVDPECWNNLGGPAAIAEYKGLLTVHATRGVHEQVERLLNMLHEAGGLKEQRVKVIR